MREISKNCSIPMTLEKHFKNLAENHPAIREIHSLWVLLKKRIEDKLVHSRSIFVNYSFHDGSHSRSIIQTIERFLGEERICRLSATDTFMLLACAYAHDYGMAQTFNKIYHILDSSEFEDFLAEKEKSLHLLEPEDAWAVKNLLDYISDKAPHIPLNDMYFSIMLIVQLYLRPTHWKGVADIKNDFDGLFLGHLKKRFIHGSEGIIEICMCHGQSVSELSALSLRADGMVGDEYHPRFVATMLRFGDLLDLDNGRFPIWFINEIAHDKSVIPKLSIMHFHKHEAVSHLLITPKRIEIIAHCRSSEIKESEDVSPQIIDAEREKKQKESYDVAALISDWTEQLSQECHEMVVSWNEIAQPDFGRPPANLNIKIYVDGRAYMAENRRLQMKMSQERVMHLLEGTSIYRDRYVGIREIIQNAIDASLLQLWKDIVQNKYVSCGLSKDSVISSRSAKGCGISNFDLFDLLDEKKAAIFKNYDVSVEVIKDMLRNKVFVVVKDKGIGITKEDMQYISSIGSSKEQNNRVCKLMDQMPAWLKPSGIFGIGLQSVFQLTDCIEFYTRQHNTPEQLISLYSYGKNHGKIEIREVPENADGMYYDNAIPGTNVKIAIEPRKFLSKDKKRSFIYYDPEFDSGEELNMLFAEISKACEIKIKETKHDYFNIYYQPLIIEKNGDKIPTTERRCLRRSYIYPGKHAGGKFGDDIQSFPRILKEYYSFTDNMAYYWDKKACRAYRLTVRPCIIEEKNGRKQLSLPEKVTNLYNISYKFNSISKADSVYMKHDFMSHEHIKRLHAGFTKLDVLILDDHPDRYMNIDRDRLREDAIDEDELLAVRNEILTHWCNYFCEKDLKKPNKRSVRSPEILFSLIFLFYQSIPADIFRQFLKPFEEFINSLNIVLADEDIKVRELWNPKNLFRVALPLPAGFSEMDNEAETCPAFSIHADKINRFPHRLIHVRIIQKERDMLSYYLNLQTSDDKIRAIRMDDGARLYDYINVFDSPEGQPTYYDSLQKKVFKPDSRYMHLLVPCLPHTFRKGRNMQSDLDYCIEWYILSPFDYKSTKILSQGIPNGTDVLDKLKDSVLNGEQFKKCVSYIMKKRFSDRSDKDELEKTIKNEYAGFIEHFVRLLMNYPPLRKH